MSLNRVELDYYNQLSFNEKVNFVMDLCDEHITKWNLFSPILLNKDYSAYFIILKSIRHYLAAYLIAAAKIDDVLNLQDLDCVIDIAQKSIFLSNHAFLNEAQKLTENNGKNYFSKGFERFISNLFFQQNKKWNDLFENTQTLEYIEWSVDSFSILLTLSACLNLQNIKGFALLTLAASINQMQGSLCDNIAVTFFGKKPLVQQFNFDNEAKRKIIQNNS